MCCQWAYKRRSATLQLIPFPGQNNKTRLHKHIKMFILLQKQTPPAQKLCLSWGSDFWPPPPTPEFLTKDFCLQPGSRMEILTKGEPGRGKNCSHCNSQHFRSLNSRVSLVRAFLSDPSSESQISRLGGWEWNNNPAREEFKVATSTLGTEPHQTPPSNIPRVACGGAPRSRITIR